MQMNCRRPNRRSTLPPLPPTRKLWKQPRSWLRLKRPSTPLKSRLPKPSWRYPDPIEANAAPADADAPIETDAPAEPAPVSLQTIAKAYGDYTRKSIEETRSYVEKLRDVRSLDKAMEVQTEFAKQAFEMFVAGSQRIYGLHKELAKQTLRPLKHLVDKPTRDPR